MTQELRRLLLWFLPGGSRGAENRARLLHEIHNRPINLNQLAKQMNLLYSAVQHHTEVLLRNSLVVASGERYGLTYSIAPWLEQHYDIFEQICNKLKLKLDTYATISSSH